MSGAEIVIGLVLGVLPLLVSTAEHYDDVFRPFRRYKRYSKELKKFQQEFLGHKTVFHNECLLLLFTFTGVERANEMLREPNHPLRKDLDLNKKLSDQLGASREACQATIGLIMEELSIIHRKSRSFELATLEEIPPGSGRYKAWKEKVGAKLKFCISENRLDQCLNRLKNYNGVFGRLSAQTKELNNCQKVAIFPPSLLRSDQRLKQRTLVRDAATQLYNALVDACASHPEHLAHFRLEPHYGIESSPKCIRFDVAFAQNLLEGPSHNTDPVWFAIESMFNENLKNEPDVPPEKAKEAWSNFKSTLKRAISQDFSPSIATKKPKRKKTVSFACPPSKVKTSAKIAPPIPLPQISMTTFPDSSLPNFCVGQDFCSHVQRCSKRPSDSFDTCIGYLQRTETCSHRVYHKHPEQNFETNPVFTLAQIFTSISGLDKSQRRSKRMLQCESLRLARQLASAVLQFHATPILKESWRSDDIVFFGKSRTAVLRTQNPDMKTPHLNVRVRNTPGQLANPSTINSILNTNPYTFGLGIILLEIAYQAPFRQLRLLESNSLLPSDVTQESTSAPELSSLSSSPASSDFVINPSSSTALDDFAVATNLSQSLSAEMGVPYARIVRKCINCDFGQGTRDLRDEGLQEAFHNDVVLELEILERAFAGLQLSDGTGERLVGIMR